jgi:hypothetical protein
VEIEPALTGVTKWLHARRRHALTAMRLIGRATSLVFAPLSNRLINAASRALGEQPRRSDAETGAAQPPRAARTGLNDCSRARR